MWFYPYAEFLYKRIEFIDYEDIFYCGRAYQKIIINLCHNDNFMISRDDMALEGDALYYRMVEEAFALLHFEGLRFWLEKETITINGKETCILVCVPSFISDETHKTFSFFKKHYPIREIRLSDTQKELGFLGEYIDQFERIRNKNKNDEDILACVCLIVSRTIVLKIIDIKDIVNESLFLNGDDVLSYIKNSVKGYSLYCPIEYDEDTLREMGVTGINLDILSMEFGPMDDSFIIAFAKYHLTPLSLQSTIRVLEYIKHKYTANIEWDKQYSAIDFDLGSAISIKEQEWYFHLQCVFQVYTDYFETSAEKSTKDRILAYCKSRICDLKPAKLTQTIANVSGTSYSGVVLRNVHDWLVERGHITMQGADNEESVNHFIYITSGKKEELVSPELKKQRIKWIGKDKYIFVTFIKELRGSFQDGEANKDPYVEWGEIHNQFDVDFGEPINGEFARKVTRTTCYKERSRLKISGHGNVRDLYLVFHPKQQQ